MFHPHHKQKNRAKPDAVEHCNGTENMHQGTIALTCPNLSPEEEAGEELGDRDTMKATLLFLCDQLRSTEWKLVDAGEYDTTVP